MSDAFVGIVDDGLKVDIGLLTAGASGGVIGGLRVGDISRLVL